MQAPEARPSQAPQAFRSAKPASLPPPRDEGKTDAARAHAASPPSGLERILAIPLTIQVELGRKRLSVRELLDLTPGAVLELGTQAGAPLAIYANQTLIARGEAVLIGERYGIRITDIVSPAERVQRLGNEV